MAAILEKVVIIALHPIFYKFSIQKLQLRGHFEFENYMSLKKGIQIIHFPECVCMVYTKVRI